MKKLPYLAPEEHHSHFIILLLCTAATLLIVLNFFFLAPQIPKVLHLPIQIVSAQTPVVDFNLLSPAQNSKVSGTVPLATTLTNGPNILSAKLVVDGRVIQKVDVKKTNSLTIYWDTQNLQNGNHKVQITASFDNGNKGTIFTSFDVQNVKTR